MTGNPEKIQSKYAFFRIAEAGDGKFIGLVTFGERPTICDQNWTIVNEVRASDLYYPQWNVKLDK
jgi:hypothetical protein